MRTLLAALALSSLAAGSARAADADGSGGLTTADRASMTVRHVTRFA